MEYSDKYVVDFTEDRYGVTYNYSKKVQDIMTLNSDFDESILYTKTKVKDFEIMYQLPTQMNKNANSNWTYPTSKTIKDSTVYVAKVRDDLEEVIEKHGVVFTDSSGSLDKFYFGYNIDKNAVVGKSGGNRFLLDFRIKNIIFKVTVTGYKKSDVEGWLNKTSDNTISASNIPFDELYEHPDDYYINKCEITSQGIYNADENIYSVYPGYRVFTTINAKKVATGLTPANSFNYNIALNSTAPFTFNLIAKGFTGGMASNKLSKLDKSIDYVDFRDVVLEPYSDFIGNEASKTYYGKNEILKETDKYVIFGCHRASTTSGNKLNNYLVDVKITFKPKAILTFLATLGVYFVGNGTTLSTNISNWNPDTIVDAVGSYTKTDGTTGDAYVYLGEMDDNGYTTGKLLRSEELKNYNGYNKDGNSKNDNFDPGKTPGGGDDDESDDIGFGYIFSGAGAFTNLWYCTQQDLTDLRQWFLGADAQHPIPEGFDPMPSIIGLFQYPISLGGDVLEEIKFRTSSGLIVSTGVQAARGLSTNLKFDLGSINIPARMRERGVPFLDYESTVECYVPFCGVFQLDTQTVIGKTLSCTLWMSPATGECNCIVYTISNGIKAPVAYGSGNMSSQIPISSNGWGSYAAALKNATIQKNQIISNVITGGVGSVLSGTGNITATLDLGEQIAGQSIGSAFGAAGLALGGAGAALGLLSTGIKAYQDINAANVGVRHLKASNGTSINGAFSGQSAWNYPMTPYVKISRPHYKKPNNYAHTQGIPLIEAKKLSECSGFTMCVGADLTGITATQTERDIISAYLTNGIIV